MGSYRLVGWLGRVTDTAHHRSLAAWLTVRLESPAEVTKKSIGIMYIYQTINFVLDFTAECDDMYKKSRFSCKFPD